MSAKVTLFFTVTNNLTYDQRMQRICRSLALAGYSVVLVGRQTNPAQQPSPQPFEQVLLPCPFASGKWMYAAFNWQLYRYLSRQLKQLAKTGAASAICAIDLDTILPCLLVSKRFNVPRVYDAHELFTELTEVKSRPLIHALWTRLERHAVPQFKQGYTVNAFIAQEFTRRYAVQYAVVRNLPLRSKAQAPMPEETLPPLPPGRFLLYQGAVNEGRSFETLVPAMLAIDMPLVIAGDGNYMPQLKKLIAQNNLQHKIWLLGLLPPGVLKQLTPLAYVGLTLFDDTGLNQYYSLANRFFDYIQAGIPQICINYPEYAAICDPESPALLISDTKSSTIALAVNKLTANHVLYQQLTLHAQNAAARLCWEKEEQILIDFWNSVINP